MRVGVIGTGYVGLVVGACLAETGHDVLCADINGAKIASLKGGKVPFYEPGLEPLVQRNLAEGRLRFTSDVGEAARESDIIFIAVGTPADGDGEADLDAVLAVADTIGRKMNGEKIVVTKSTVPVGTAARVREVIARHTKKRFHVCANPEFLKEGAAVEDFTKPDRVVIGTESDYAREVLSELYAPFVRTGKPILFMDIASAELTKYAANALLATRISFMNMIARLCGEVGADVDVVRKGVGSDTRIGSAFLFAGCGYGGSCFPKDVKALTRILRKHGVDASLLEATERINETQKQLLLDAIDARYGRPRQPLTFAVWGLSFKPETDDMRDAPSLVVVRGLLERGFRVQVHDPQALRVARQHFGEDVTYCEHSYDALKDADGLVILTEWLAYRRPNFEKAKGLMRAPVIFDGRNLYEPGRMRELGFEYYSIGRVAATPLRAVAAT